MLNQVVSNSLTRPDSAANDLCRTLLPLLERQVDRRLAYVDSHDIGTAIEDTLLMYLQNPRQFNPARGSLLNWLVPIAVNRARDLHRRTSRRRRHEVASGTDLTDHLSSTQHPELDSSARPVDEMRRRLLGFARDSGERAFLKAQLAGESMVAQAVAIGAQNLPTDRQREAIYRTMERIAKRGKRRAGT